MLWENPTTYICSFRRTPEDFHQHTEDTRLQWEAGSTTPCLHISQCHSKLTPAFIKCCFEGSGLLISPEILAANLPELWQYESPFLKAVFSENLAFATDFSEFPELDADWKIKLNQNHQTPEEIPKLTENQSHCMLHPSGIDLTSFVRAFSPTRIQSFIYTDFCQK